MVKIKQSSSELLKVKLFVWTLGREKVCRLPDLCQLVYQDSLCLVAKKIWSKQNLDLVIDFMAL